MQFGKLANMTSHFAAYCTNKEERLRAHLPQNKPMVCSEVGGSSFAVLNNTLKDEPIHISRL